MGHAPPDRFALPKVHEETGMMMMEHKLKEMQEAPEATKK